MKPVVPAPPMTPDWQLVEYAKHQDEYIPLTVLRNTNRSEVPVISVWEPDEDEIAVLAQQIADGKVRISVQQWLFADSEGKPNPLTPMQVKVGPFVEPYDACPMEKEQ